MRNRTRFEHSRSRTGRVGRFPASVYWDGTTRLCYAARKARRFARIPGRGVDRESNQDAIIEAAGSSIEKKRGAGVDEQRMLF